MTGVARVGIVGEDDRSDLAFQSGAGKKSAGACPRSCSVVIPCYGQLEEAMHVAESLASESAEILKQVVVVVDKAGRAVEERRWERNGVELHVVPVCERLGAAGARNKGIAMATGDVVVFLDADCRPQSGFVEAHLAAHQNDGVVAAAGPSVVVPRQDPVVRALRLSGLLYAFELPGGSRELYWSPSCNLSVRRSVLVKHNYDQRFPKSGGGEDVDLGFRVGQEGRITCAPAAVVYHPRWNGSLNIARRVFRWGRAEAILAEKMARQSVEKLAAREPTVAALLLLLTFVAACGGVVSGSGLPVLVVPGYAFACVLAEAARVRITEHGRYVIKEALLAVLCLLLFDAGAVIERLRRCPGLLLRQVIFFPNQMSGAWDDRIHSIWVNGFLFVAGIAWVLWITFA